MYVCTQKSSILLSLENVYWSETRRWLNLKIHTDGRDVTGPSAILYWSNQIIKNNTTRKGMILSSAALIALTFMKWWNIITDLILRGDEDKFSVLRREHAVPDDCCTVETEALVCLCNCTGQSQLRRKVSTSTQTIDFYEDYSTFYSGEAHITIWVQQCNINPPNE